MSGWELAGSLEVIRAKIDALAPRRSKASDGTIGDEAHQKAGTSDHLPRLIAGRRLVTALDVTHDPAGGMDCAQLAAALRAGRDVRIKYVIWSHRIMSGAGGTKPWTWRTYAGANPHTAHLHLSVVADPRCQDRTPWALPGLVDQEDRMPTAEQIAKAVVEQLVENAFGDRVSILQVLNGIEKRVADLQAQLDEIDKQLDAKL